MAFVSLRSGGGSQVKRESGGLKEHVAVFATLFGHPLPGDDTELAVEFCLWLLP